MNTQINVDISAARGLAADLGLACEIEADDNDGMTITMDTGEIEPACGLIDAATIIRAYAQVSMRLRCIPR